MQLSIMLINACNLTCNMCRHVEKSTGVMMSIEQYCKILDQCDDLSIAGSKITAIRLDGSREPLLYPKLGAALVEAKKRRLGTSFVTNGVLLTKEKSEMIIESGLDYIKLSVTGITPLVYGKFQGFGKADVNKQLKTVCKNVEQLVQIRDKRKARMTIAISYIVTDESVEDATNALLFWKRLGVDEVGFYSDINNVEYASAQGYKLSYRPGSEECKHSVTIASNGDIYPCCKAPGEEMTIGNCFETPLHEIFISQKYYDLASRIVSLDLNLLPEGCKTCPAISYI